MTILITIAIIFLALLALGPIGMAIIAGTATLIWAAGYLLLWVGGAMLGAIIFPIWWLFDREAAVAAWKAGRAPR